MKSTYLRVRPHTFGWILQRGNRAVSIHRTFDQALDAFCRLTRIHRAVPALSRISANQ